MSELENGILDVSLRAGIRTPEGDAAQERSLGKIGLSLRVGEVKPDGSVEWEPWRKSHSFVKQFLQCLYADLLNTNIANVKDYLRGRGVLVR